MTRQSPQAQPTQDVWLMQRVEVRTRHIGIVFAVVAVFAIGLAISNTSVRAMSRQLEDMKVEVRSAQSEVAEKERKLSFIGTDEYIEQQARKQFGLIQPGEIRFLPDTTMSNDF